MRRNDHVKASARTLDMFEALVQAQGPLTLSELARAIDAPVSSCHALVKTLQDRGYVYVLSEKKRVYPTHRLGVLAAAIARHDPILDRVTPILHRLVQATGETAILGKHQGDHVVYLIVIEGTHTIRFNARSGDVRPSHSSAIGKSTLSLLNDAELGRTVRRLRLTAVTDQTVTDGKKLLEEIVESRKKGYFISRGETVVDVSGVSVPLSLNGEFFALGVAGPSSRVVANLERYVEALRKLKDEIAYQT